MRKIINKILFIPIFLLFIHCGQSQIKTPIGTMKKFEEFKTKEKFITDNSTFYPGIGDPKLKPILTDKINLASDDFKKVAESKNATNEDYLNELKEDNQNDRN